MLQPQECQCANAQTLNLGGCNATHLNERTQSEKSPSHTRRGLVLNRRSVEAAWPWKLECGTPRRAFFFLGVRDCQLTVLVVNSITNARDVIDMTTSTIQEVRMKEDD